MSDSRKHLTAKSQGLYFWNGFFMMCLVWWKLRIGYFKKKLFNYKP